MRFSISLVTAGLVAATIAPISAAAQTAWDAPPMISHVVPAGVSFFLLSPSGGDLGGLVTFRHEAGPVGMGYRLSVTDENASDDLAIAAGVDISGFLARGVEGAPIDVMWWSGAGLGWGEDTVVSLPLGAVIGWSGQGGDVILSPYGGGHITLDISDVIDDNVSLNGSFDFGLDVVLSSGWLVRFGGSVGDRDALAIGVKIDT
ncbi:MAG: hypothetical protein P8L45_10835 [Longimicrobiales bacterium]|nr:hypothetical protein [Longimicrobiales bacterium]